MYNERDLRGNGDDGAKAKKWIKRSIIGVAIVILIAILMPATCVSSNERGVRVRFGAVQDGVVMPGLRFHVPLIEQIKTYSIVPRQDLVTIAVGEKGAITSDNQTIGVDYEVYWTLDESRLDDAARNYTEQRLENLINLNTRAAIKSELGKYQIFDLASTIDKTTSEIRAALVASIKQYPVIITDVKNTNFDWDPEFDKSIKETQQLKQEVLKKAQEVEKATLEFSKNVAESKAKAEAQIADAEGEKQSAILKAQGELESAKLAKQAKIEEGEGIRIYNEKVAINLPIEIKLRELEIKKIRATRWDGTEVSNQVWSSIPFSAPTKSTNAGE